MGAQPIKGKSQVVQGTKKGVVGAKVEKVEIAVSTRWVSTRPEYPPWFIFSLTIYV